jgi:hypothetical protein
MQEVLRPHFTSVIHNILAARNSVNVYSDQTKELKRLIDDLNQSKPADIRLIRLSLKKYADNFAALLSTLCERLDVKVGGRMDFATVIHQFLDSNQKNIWLVFEDFDHMPAPISNHKSLDEAGAGYNIDFLRHLDGLRNHAQVAMLFTSTYKLATTDLYLGGKLIRGSRLELSYHRKLPPLSSLELEQELFRSNPHLQQNKLFREQFCSWAIAQALEMANPCDFLQYVADHLILDQIKTLSTFKKKFKEWQSNFEPPPKKDKVTKPIAAIRDSSKNPVRDSALQAGRDIHIGDTTNNYYYKVD